jgi:hypothetical protein
MAGEKLKSIEGHTYVWQPIDINMMGETNSELSRKITNAASGITIYMEVWLYENARKITSNPINKDYFKYTRPKESDILQYLESGTGFEYNTKSAVNTEVNIAGKVVNYVGARKDGSGGKNTAQGLNLVNGRIFDEPSSLTRISSCADAYNSIFGSNKKKWYKNILKKKKIAEGDYNAYWDDPAYENCLKDSVNFLDKDVQCFGIQWKTGEIYWSKDDSRCDKIEDHGVTVSRGWPKGWTLNYYRMQAGDGVDYQGVDYQADAGLTDEEALSRRSQIRRENNKLLLLKNDVNI